MGVPKFFRWISERYPKINQPFHAPPNEETKSKYFPSTATSNNVNTDGEAINKQDDKVYIQKNNILPEFDRLYLDMNGIIHCCSHNNATEDLNEARQESLDDPPTSNSTPTPAPAPGSVQISEAEIFRNVCYYVDRIVTDVAKPKELVYMAIDGVAPRAKMNQQRSRRYRSGKEKEIESTFHKAHLLAQKKKIMELKYDSESSYEEIYGVDALQLGLDYDGTNVTSRNSKSDVTYSKESVTSMDSLEEVEPGRFSGMFQTSSEDTQTSHQGTTESTSFDLDYDEFCKSIAVSSDDESEISNEFHSNQITPGTPFFERCTAHLEHFIKRKLHTDPRWAHLTIIFSGPNVPGEGEHKIMDFIRDQKNKDGYNPNTRHCLFGQDGDLIMLGLATHEPHFTLLREEVVFDQARKKEKERRSIEAVNALNSSLDETGMANERVSASIDSYIHNTNFELLHMSILRDYLAFEFETKEVLPESPFELEPTIDDFVFMTFFVGNDFLPHMPAIDIADEAFDLLFYTYKKNRKKWLKEDEYNLSKLNKRHPYMTDSGEIVSGKRLERFLSELGKHEDPYYSNKKRSEDSEIKRQRKSDKKYGRESSIPPDEILAAKNEWDKTNYMEMLMSISKNEAEPLEGFKPVSSSKALLNGLDVVKKHYKFQSDEDQDELEEGFLNRMGTLIRNSLSTKGEEEDTTSRDRDHNVSLEQVSDDLKGRYYYEKFHFSPLDAKQHIALRKAYIEGLVWNLKYYFKGCACWDWFYPYHYGPMLSDLRDIDLLLEKISFDGNKSEPLKPFEQLMACLPPSSANLLPKPYQWLMKSPKSPIIDFYPESFTVDMNGKRWPWEAVVLLPFIDSKRLVQSSRHLVGSEFLSEDEMRRNQLGDAVVYKKVNEQLYDLPALNERPNFEAIEGCTVKEERFGETEWKYGDESSCFRPEILQGAKLPYPGYPTLRDAPIHAMSKRKLGINVFGLRSRYKTAVLELDSEIPSIISASSIAKRFIGSTLYFRYPFLQEGFVTAVSDEKVTVRGTSEPRLWDDKEARAWKLKKDVIERQYESGDGLTGSGGLRIPSSNVTLSIRPLKEIETLPDGSKVKIYARIEIDVPLIAAIWQPSEIDPRLVGIPARLEKNPYRFGSQPLKPFVTVKDNKKQKRPMLSLTNTAGLKSKILPDFSVGTSTKSSILPPVKNGYLGSSSSSYSTLSANPLMKVKRDRKVSAIPRRHFGSKSITIAAAVAGFVMAKGTNAMNPLPLLSPEHNLPINLRGGAPGNQFDLFSNVYDDDITTTGKTPPPLEFAHGTTTLSFTFKDGIVAAVDSRASIGTFVGSKTTQKVLPVSEHILGTMAGGAADCSFWIRRLQAEARCHELTEGKEVTVSRVSRLLADYLYANRQLNLSVGTMIMGVDDEFGPSIYYVDNKGTRIKGDMFSVGSGSTFALGVLDTDRREEMNEEEAIALGIKAIRHATFRDAYSGGYIAVYVITRDGFKKVFSEDLPLMK